MIFWGLLFLLFASIALSSFFFSEYSDSRDVMQKIGCVGMTGVIILFFAIGFIGGNAFLPDSAIYQIEKENYKLLPLDADGTYLQYATNSEGSSVILVKYMVDTGPRYKTLGLSQVRIVSSGSDTPRIVNYNDKLNSPWNYFFVRLQPNNHIIIYIDSDQIAFTNAVIDA